mmetsp:Transcript_91491/g.112020  ORF Transcript_91491/g.112020 Transcript_91491/m.112020 type:complete len:158 (+) Transcript_91491:87-560(+)
MAETKEDKPQKKVGQYGGNLKLIQHKSIKQLRREQRTKGAWKGIYRDPVKLYLRGVIMGYRRSRLNIRPSRALVKIEDVKTRKDARYYLGHRVVYIYRAAQKKDPRSGKKQLRVIAGKITNPHGNNGTVRVRFTPNIPARAMGKRCRIMLWPHKNPN